MNNPRVLLVPITGKTDGESITLSDDGRHLSGHQWVCQRCGLRHDNLTECVIERSGRQVCVECAKPPQPSSASRGGADTETTP